MSLPTPYYQRGPVTIYCGDCREIIPELGPVNSVITDPPYGVELKGKTSKNRGGGRNIRPGQYEHADTREYVENVVVPAINQCISIADTIAVTPGTRSLFLYPEATEVG